MVPPPSFTKLIAPEITPLKLILLPPIPTRVLGVPLGPIVLPIIKLPLFALISNLFAPDALPFRNGKFMV